MPRSRLLLAAVVSLAVVAACRTVQATGPSIFDEVVEGIRELDGGLVDIVLPDGGSETFPASDYEPPFCDARLNPTIPFPPELKDAGVYGEVQVKCIVQVNGFQRECKLLQGVGAMDQPVMATVKMWRCKPAVLHGVPVASQHVTFVSFKPKEPPPPPAPTLAPAAPIPALPAGLPEVKAPQDNPLSPEKVELGFQLFFDKRLSKDGSMSCESCHHLANGWTSAQALDAKVGGGMNTRNAPSMLNLGTHPFFYWDGRMPTLEAVSAAAWKGQLGADPAENAKALNAQPTTKALFDRAFGTTTGATAENVPMALASFFRALGNGNSPWDRFTAGDKTAMSKEAQAGWTLFQKAGCVTCHLPPLFTDLDFHALGVNDDAGRKNATKLDADQGKFKTPSLRNVALTGPYLHDGSAKTLPDAVAFMAKGGNVKPGSDPKLKPVKLSKKDAANLEAFLNALTGESNFTAAPAQP